VRRRRGYSADKTWLIGVAWLLRVGLVPSLASLYRVAVTQPRRMSLHPLHRVAVAVICGLVAMIADACLHSLARMYACCRLPLL
jgi:hypothetical protein